ncbi:MAG: glycosyltransferase [Pseudochelatococcus sp.]|jgi:glycosyltransferase involved in cell wall biosynthesis|uniref:glycosyltransferase n=1 Tax=Pseudochelatococcus sp. TaxID=2020869 RepID=UPI003D8EE89C
MTVVAAMPGKAERDVSAGKRRFLYIQPGTASFAGIERVVDTVCTELAEQYGSEFEVDVLYTSIHKNYPTEPRKYNAIRELAKHRLKLMAVYRDIISRNRYDVVVVPQVEPTVTCWLSCLGLGQKLIMHIHGNPDVERRNFKSGIMFFVMKHVVLRRLSSIFGTSPRQLDSFNALYPSAVPRVWVPNPVRRFDDGPERASESGAGAARPVTYVNVGRFSDQKGQDILIDAFAKLHKERPDTRLKLVGHGVNEPALRAQIDRLGLADVATIEHHPTNPQAALAASDIYVSTSRWEGWSLVICEALRFGLPVIATDCDFGPSDILTDRRLGTLVPASAEEALVEAMKYYYDNLASEKEFSEYRKEAVDVYSAERVVHVHAEALKRAAG